MKKRTPLYARNVAWFLLGLGAFAVPLLIESFFPYARADAKLLFDLIAATGGLICMALATFWDWPPPKM